MEYHNIAISGTNGAIATEHYLSAQAGLEMFLCGGNAFDAAASATFVESLVNPHMFTLGGECPMLIYPAKEKRVIAVNGNTEAPHKATIDEYKRRGLKLIPNHGLEAAGVPAAIAALLDMLGLYGTLPLYKILEPAIRLARNGFPLHAGILNMEKFGIKSNLERFRKRWPETCKLYLKEITELPKENCIIKNEAYASLLINLADEFRAYESRGPKEAFKQSRNLFYCGDIARELENFVKERDGLLEFKDLKNYKSYFESPVKTRFMDTTVFKCGPWSQGPVFLQHLNILEQFNLSSLKHNSADYLHIWIEAAKLAYADREQYYGDPRFVDVPIDKLLNKEYARLRSFLIDIKQASSDLKPGNPFVPSALLAQEKVFMMSSWGYGTVHVAAADKEGNLAALTPSGGWISGNEVVPFLGFPLGTRLQTFYLVPGHPNALQPRKRPRTTLTPSIAFKNNKPWLAFGTMGGDQQDQWTLQFFINRTVFGMNLAEAIDAPKVSCDHFPGTFYPHEAFPKQVRVEKRIPDSVINELNQRGHKIVIEPPWSLGFICAVEIDKDKNIVQAAADQRGHKTCVFPSTALAI